MTTTQTAEAALDYLQSRPFIWMLTDLNLPDMSGIELTQLHRVWEQGSKKHPLPIFILTAYVNDKIKQACYHVGINGILEKPFVEQHIQIIENFIKQ